MAPVFGHRQGKLANIITEIAEGAEIADAQLKSLVSGETTTAEHKHRDPFDFTPYAKHWFGTNHLPHTRDFSDALFRRAVVLAFNNKFDGERRDVRLEASYRNSFRALKESFPTHLMIAEAPAEYIARTIAKGGLSNQKAKAIRHLLDAVMARFGEPTLEPLRAMSDKGAEAFLLSLPGVGKKIARRATWTGYRRGFRRSCGFPFTSTWCRWAGKFVWPQNRNARYAR